MHTIVEGFVQYVSRIKEDRVITIGEVCTFAIIMMSLVNERIRDVKQINWGTLYSFHSGMFSHKRILQKTLNEICEKPLFWVPLEWMCFFGEGWVVSIPQRRMIFF